jgi:hypothetical protein
VRLKLAALTASTLLASAAIAGCGDEGETSENGEQVRETVEPLPKLPRRWTPHVNENGFAIAVPPRWKATVREQLSELRSPDRLVAISIVADHTEAALEVPLRKFARMTLRGGLPGVREIEARDPRPYRHRYDAVSIAATAIAGKDPPVRERLLLVVIRREGLATYTALVAENAQTTARPYRDEIDRSLRSLRGRPIGARPNAGEGRDDRGRDGDGGDSDRANGQGGRDKGRR